MGMALHVVAPAGCRNLWDPRLRGDDDIMEGAAFENRRDHTANCSDREQRW